MLWSRAVGGYDFALFEERATLGSCSSEEVRGQFGQICHDALFDDAVPFVWRELLELRRRPDPLISHGCHRTGGVRLKLVIARQLQGRWRDVRWSFGGGTHGGPIGVCHTRGSRALLRSDGS